MKHLGYSAWVSVNDTPLTEYGETVKDSEISCWIPSEVGQYFVVHFDSPGVLTVSGDVYLDGQFSRGRIAYANIKTTRSISGLLTSETSEKPFMFSRLQTTDDDSYVSRKNTNLGEIKLIIKEVVVGDKMKFKEVRYSQDKVHECSKKAMAHQVGLGTEKAIPRSDVVHVEDIRTIATFVFRYRPIDLLRANEIAPPLASGSKRAADAEIIDMTELTESSDGDDDENEERIAALQVQLAALQNKSKRRRKRIKLDPDVKKEADGRLVTSGDVIDLT